jgi:hypothetical protein
VQGGEPALSLSPQFCPRAALVPASSGCSSHQFGPNLTAQGIREERWKVFETSGVTQTENLEIVCWPVLDCCFKACAKYASPQDRPTCHTNKYDLSALTVYSSIHKYSQKTTQTHRVSLISLILLSSSLRFLAFVWSRLAAWADSCPSTPW